MSEGIAAEFKRVSFAYGAEAVIDDLSLTITEGRTTALFGPSGAGKTTILRLLAGLEKPQSGEIMINGAVAASPHQWIKARHRGVGVCFQEPALWDRLSLLDHIELPLKTRIANRNERAQTAHDLLERFGLGALAARRPRQLSGGERKRAELARALAAGPRLLLLDEPYANLEGPLRSELTPYIRDLQSDGMAIVLITHQLEDALSLSDQLTVIENGKALHSGNTQDVALDPRSRRAAALLGYQTFIESRADNGLIDTALGGWTVQAADGPGIAAWTPDGIEAGRGSLHGRVEQCEFIGRGYRIAIRHETITLSAMSPHEHAIGDETSFELIREPAWLTES